LLCLDPSAGHTLVPGKAEIVVGAEIQHILTADPNDRSLPRGNDTFGLGQPLGVDIGKFRPDAFVKAGSHARSATPFPAEIEPPKLSRGRSSGLLNQLGQWSQGAEPAQRAPHPTPIMHDP
jgi:hypothetical protein